MNPPRAKPIRRTQCLWTFCALLFCCGGCHSTQDHAAFDPPPGRPLSYPVHCTEGCIGIGPFAGYCETNWTPLDAAAAGECPVSYPSSGYEFTEYFSGREASINAGQANSRSRQMAQLYETASWEDSAGEPPFVPAHAVPARGTRRDSVYRHNTGEATRSVHTPDTGVTTGNPHINTEQSAGKQLERWQRRS